MELELYKILAKFVFEETGIYYGENDYYRLDSRIDKLLKFFQFESKDQLLDQLKKPQDPDFPAKVIDLCTNNETYFFRDKNPFNALKNHIMPERKGSLSIWSCACSSGQEPLSILMTILEHEPTRSVDIMATDISKTILEKAQAGVYNSLEVQRGLSDTLLNKYFQKADEKNWQARAELLNKIKYSHFNLFSENYPIKKFDVIFCRNVLIYQNQQNKKKILENLYSCLKPGGYLIMGAGESLIGCKVELEQKSYDGTMVFKKSIPATAASA